MFFNNVKKNCGFGSGWHPYLRDPSSKKNGIMLEFFPLGRLHVLKLITNKLANLRGCVKPDTLRKNTLEKKTLWKNC